VGVTKPWDRKGENHFQGERRDPPDSRRPKPNPENDEGEYQEKETSKISAQDPTALGSVSSRAHWGTGYLQETEPHRVGRRTFLPESLTDRGSARERECSSVKGSDQREIKPLVEKGSKGSSEEKPGKNSRTGGGGSPGCGY